MFNTFLGKVVIKPLLCASNKQKRLKIETEMNEKERDFTALVNTYKQTIYSVCLMYSNDSQEVDDLVQQTLINLWAGYDKFEGRSDIKTWIWRIAINTCISEGRKEKRRVQTSPLESIGITADRLIPKDSKEKQIGMLYDRIHRLGIFDRAIVLLWLENQTYEEIGKIMGLTPQNVGVRLLRIREKLMNMSND